MPPKGRGRAKQGGQQEAQQQPGPQQQIHQAPPHPPQAYGRGRGDIRRLLEDAAPARQEPPIAQREQRAEPTVSGPEFVPEKPITKRVDPEQLCFEYEKMQMSTPLPRKPGIGKLGRPIRLISNCFSLDVPSGNVYHYDVEIFSKGRSMTTRPTTDTSYRCMGTKRNREVINEMLDTNVNFQNAYAAYDGRKNLYTRRPLKINKELKCDVKMKEGDPNDPRGPRTDDFHIVVKPVLKKDGASCAISLDALHALYEKKVNSVPQDAVMAIETVLRHGPCMRYYPVGRSFFYPPLPQDVHPLGGGKEIWFGYHQSLRLGQWGPMINLDITATTFNESGSVIEYIARYLKVNINELHRVGGLKDNDIKKLSKELENLRIEVTHIKSYRRRYRIMKLTSTSANKLVFNTTENGVEQTKTVAQYFAEKYKPLKYPHFPCIQGNPLTKNVYLPLEVCELLEGQHSKKKLEDRQNAEMIKFTARPPRKRFNEIRDILKRTNYHQDQHLREFGIRVRTEPLQLDGRVIDAPNVRYKRGGRDEKIKPHDGSWDMRDLQYFRASEIETWVLLSFANRSFCRQEHLNKFAEMLCSVAKKEGININRPALIDTIDSRRRPSMQTILSDIKNRFNANLVIAVLPAMEKEIYGEIKQAAETILGVITQCIKDTSITDQRKFNPSLVSNLCQKINAKTGGVNNSLTPGETPAIFQRPVIVIGADITHPPPSGDIKPSIAAAVGSLDAHPSRYAVTIRAQRNRSKTKRSIEIIVEFESMIIDLLRAFHRSTRGKKPEKIVVYRDGVSDGQFEVVRDHEVRCIRTACKKLQQDYEPEISFIVVQKRHHTRFMPQDDRNGVGRMKNVPPGTTVDTAVNHPLNFDFFLCSHFGLQGTSRPAHYTVIEDDNKFTADELQKMTYFLCHTYARCTKSISSPAPVMYAHLAAFRARLHLLSTLEGSTASSDTSSSSDTPIADSVKQAIQVVSGLANTMYFV